MDTTQCLDRILEIIDLNLGGFKEMGGKGSGNWGHKGRPGKKGGSAPSKGRDVITPSALKQSEKLENIIESRVAGREDEDLLRDTIDDVISDMKSKYGDYTEDFEEIDYSYAEDALYGWTVDSHHRDALWMQVAAEREFGSKVSDYTKNKIGKSVHGIDTTDEERLVKTIYERTQADLKNRGVDTTKNVVLYRGEVRPNAPKSGTVSRNAIEAWTTSKDKAEFYVERNKDLEGSGYVVTTNIPINRILSLPHTGMGVGSVNEVVILGGKSMPVDVEKVK